MAENVSLLRIVLEASDSGVGRVVGGAKSALSSLGTVATGVAVGGLALVAGGMVALGTASFNVANEVDVATANMQSALGLTADEAERFGDRALEVWGDNFTGSIEEAGDALIATRQQLKRLSDEELTAATENALRFTDVFGDQGADLEGSLNAANVLMEKFGLTQEQAFDFMTTGFQRGLNASGDFLDSIGEYGNLFAEGGASAEQFFSVLETGAEGGVLGTDKAADAFKEFNIILQEGSEGAIAALEPIFGHFIDLSENIEASEKEVAKLEAALQKASAAKTPDPAKIASLTQELQVAQAELGSFQERNGQFVEGIVEMEGGVAGFYDQLRSGSITGIESMEMILQAIEEIEDPLARQRTGVALFGTMWEDMGTSAMLSIDATSTSMAEMAGSTEALNAKYDTLGQAMEGLKRQALVSLAPIGDILLSGVNAAMPGVEAAVGWFTTTGAPAIQRFAADAGAWIAQFVSQATPIINDFAARWDQTVAPAMLLVQDALNRISQALGMTNGEFSMMNGTLWALQSVLNAVVIGVQAGAIAFQGVAWAVEQVSQAIQIGIGLWDQMGSIVESVGDQIPDWLKPGSPPPLFFALRDINRALDEMPDMNEAFGFNNAPAGLPLADNGLVAAPASASGNGTVFHITIQANDEEGGRRAAEAFVGDLRNRGLVLA